MVYTEAEINHQGKNLVYFTFPWMNSIDINKTPNWVNDTVVSDISERFNNGDKRTIKNVKPWDSMK